MAGFSVKFVVYCFKCRFVSWDSDALLIPATAYAQTLVAMWPWTMWLSNMKKYSEDKFVLKSNLAPSEIRAFLKSRTLIKKSLTNESTDKDFIGRFDDYTFSIFDSSFFPNGVACILHGQINQDSEIILTTTLHKGLRILLLVWSIVMTGLFIGFWFIDSSRVDLVLIPIFMPIAILIFRLALHGQYVYTRNRAMRKFKNLLQITT